MSRDPGFFPRAQSTPFGLDSISEEEQRPQLLIDFKFLAEHLRFIKEWSEYLCDLHNDGLLHILIEKKNGEPPPELNNVLISMKNSRIGAFFHEYEYNDTGELITFSDILNISKGSFVLSASESVTKWAKEKKIEYTALFEGNLGEANESDIVSVEEALFSLQTSPKKIILSLDLDDTTILFDRKNKTFRLNQKFLERLRKHVNSIKQLHPESEIECVVTTARKPQNNLSQYEHILDQGNDNETTKGHVNFLLSQLNRLDICNQAAIRVFHASCDGSSDGKRLCLSAAFPDKDGFFVIHFDDRPEILDDFTESLIFDRLSMRAVEVINPYAECTSNLDYWRRSSHADVKESPSVVLTLN